MSESQPPADADAKEKFRNALERKKGKQHPHEAASQYSSKANEGKAPPAGGGVAVLPEGNRPPPRRGRKAVFPPKGGRLGGRGGSAAADRPRPPVLAGRVVAAVEDQRVPVRVPLEGPDGPDH